MTAWFRQRPQLRLRTVVPVTSDDDTVELHGWYEAQVFADLSGQHPAPGVQP